MSLFTKHNKMYCPKCASTLACMNGFIMLSRNGWIVGYIINITKCQTVDECNFVWGGKQQQRNQIHWELLWDLKA